MLTIKFNPPRGAVDLRLIVALRWLMPPYKSCAEPPVEFELWSSA